MNSKKTNRSIRKIMALLLVFSVLVSVCPISAFSADKSVSAGNLLLATISDIRWLSSELAGDNTTQEDFTAALLGENIYYKTQSDILETALESLAADVIGRSLQYVVLCGDLSYNGEKQSHEELATRLAKFEKDTGIRVFVINGEHDINNSDAQSFNGYNTAEKTAPSDFMRIYDAFGYAEAYHTYADTEDLASLPIYAGMLSYSVRLDDGYRLILLDNARYSRDVTESNLNEHETAGIMTYDLENWLMEEIADAKANGEIPVCVSHWNISGSNYILEYIKGGCVIENGYRLQESLADAGMHFWFSGHSGISDVDITYSDNGEAMYGIVTGALTQFPASFRETELQYNTTNKRLQIDCNTYEVDDTRTREIPFSGNTPYSIQVFRNQFADGNVVDYLMQILSPLVLRYADAIIEAGGIIPFAEAKTGFDIHEYFDDMLYGGLSALGTDIFTADNIISLLDDIDKQLVQQYLYNPRQTLTETVRPIIEKLCAVPVSELPCTKFTDTLGFGNPEKNGTLGDLLMSIFYYVNEGNEYIEDDAFVQSALTNLKDGSITPQIAQIIRDDIIQNILINRVLANIEVHVSSLFTTHATQLADTCDSIYTIMTALIAGGFFDTLKEKFPTQSDYESVADYMKVIATAVFNVLADYKADTSYLNLANLILQTVEPEFGSSVPEVADYLFENYIGTDYNCEGIGYILWKLADCCLHDADKDNNVRYLYIGKIVATASEEDMQLPTLVNMTFGTSAEKTCNISWYTKYSVAGTDIELYATNTEPTFTKKDTLPSGVTAHRYTEKITRSCMGIPIGTIGFCPYSIEVYHHKIELTGLRAGTTYYYRIGDASENFWSATGTFTTADNKDDSFTFLQFSDTESLSEAQAKTWGTLFSDALTTVPETDFIVHTGDMVENGSDFTQWQTAFQAAKTGLMKTPLVALTGNHDALGAYTSDNYFAVGENSLPTQYTDKGVFYSYNYNNAHFVVLNTNYLNEDGGLSDKQLQWLESDLKNNDADWTILLTHTSAYSVGQHANDKEQTSFRQYFLKQIVDYDIDLILSGHDHAYMRSNIINHYGARLSGLVDERTDENGIVYDYYEDPTAFMLVNCGSSGTKAGKQPELIQYANFYTEHICASPKANEDAVTSPMFVSVTVGQNDIAVSAYTRDAQGQLTVFDKAVIAKEKITYISGDINNNGKLEASDARQTLRYSVALDWNTATNYTLLAADFNNDGNITSGDARAILRASVGLDLNLVEKRTVFKSELYQ